MSSSPFETLPSEIVTNILAALPSPRTVHSLIRASPRICKIFLLSKESILSSTLYNAIPSKLRPDVLRVHELHQLRPLLRVYTRAAQNEQYAVFEKLLVGNEQAILGELPLLPILPLVRTWCTLEYFVEDFANCTLDPIPRHSEAFVAPSTTVLQKPSGYNGLSDVELSRLRNAFVRFELFCSLMAYSTQKERSVHSTSAHQGRINNLFLSTLETWQMEELTCIFNHLYSRIETLFDNLERDYIEEVTEGVTSSTNKAVNEEIQQAFHTHFFTTRAKQRYHTDYIGQLLAHGLSFLRRLFQSGRKQKKQIIFYCNNVWQNRAVFPVRRPDVGPVDANELPFLQSFQGQWRDREPAVRIGSLNRTPAFAHHQINQLQQALNQPAQFAHNHPAPISPEQEIPEYEGDRLGTPNWGFLWAHGFTGNNVCGRTCDDELRSLGYVFWDKDRLQAMGILGHVHLPAGVHRSVARTIAKTEKAKMSRDSTWPGRGRDCPRQRRNRADEPSAEQILKDMGFVLTPPPAETHVESEDWKARVSDLLLR